METLHISATKQFPEIVFNPDGHLRISGRLINDHIIDFFRPLFQWIDNAKCENVTVEIHLEYLNTTGAFHLVELMRKIESNRSIKNIEVLWRYEEDDEEHYELGNFIEQKMKKTKFNYLSHA